VERGGRKIQRQARPVPLHPGEKEVTLKPWLNDHPIKGWVFFDPAGKTGNAYGLEQPVTVYIGPDRKIIGFSNFPMADERTINAALEHRVTTTHPTEATIKAFMASNQVALDAEPRRMPRPDDNKPNFPPSYALHVTPSSNFIRGNSSSDTFRSLQGFTLTDAIGYVYDFINPVRIQLPATIDNRKYYDFAMVLPQPESREKMNALFQQGILDYFHLTARRESRLVEVYVVTADPNHAPLPVAPQVPPGMGSIGGSSIGFTTKHIPGETPDPRKPLGIDALRSLSTSGSMDEFCHRLESRLDRPVVNETNLHGQYLYNVQSTDGPQNDFLQHLHDQLGLTITPGQRNVEILVFEPR
jgi:uncharacterized protein (TIGR03435 family)